MKTIVRALHETVCRFYLFNFSWSLDFFLQQKYVFSFKIKKKKVAKHSFKEYSSVLKLFYLRGKEQEGFLPALRKKQRTHSHLRLMPK